MRRRFSSLPTRCFGLQSSTPSGVFFTDDFKEGKWIASDDYASKCLALDKSPLRASLLWLKQMSAIDDADIARVDQIREHRNELAHDLPKFLGTADAEINVQLLVGIYELVAKIDRWWIREVDMTIDPDYDGQEVADEDITSGNMMFIQMMLRIATGEDSAVFWELLANANRQAWPWAGPNTCPLVEAYPAAQLRHWGLPFQQYNGLAGQDNRAAIIADLTVNRDLNVGDGFLATLQGDADALDAVLCSYAARAIFQNQLGVALPAFDAWQREGWIAVHN